MYYIVSGVHIVTVTRLEKLQSSLKSHSLWVNLYNIGKYFTPPLKWLRSKLFNPQFSFHVLKFMSAIP